MKRRVSLWRGSGFTLIELLIVILIIGILAGLIVSAVGIAKRKADEARARTMIKAFDSGLEMYKSNFGYLPGRGSPSDPYDPDANVIGELITELRGDYVKISQGDIGIYEAEGEQPRPAEKAEIEDDSLDKVVIDPWGWSYVARENESKEKKQDWMRNKDFMDIYSWGENQLDDTMEPVEGQSDDDLGNW